MATTLFRSCYERNRTGQRVIHRLRVSLITSCEAKLTQQRKDRLFFKSKTKPAAQRQAILCKLCLLSEDRSRRYTGTYIKTATQAHSTMKVNGRDLCATTLVPGTDLTLGQAEHIMLPHGWAAMPKHGKFPGSSQNTW
jgi:hypothetical protein